MAAQYSRAVRPSDIRVVLLSRPFRPRWILLQDNPFAPTKAALSEPAGVASETSPPTREMLALQLQGPAAIVFDAAVFCLYYVSFEFLTGRTLGKFLTGTRVVSDTGGPPTLGQVAMRSVLRLIPMEAFTFFARGPGLHDRGSRTRVVLNRYVA